MGKIDGNAGRLEDEAPTTSTMIQGTATVTSVIVTDDIKQTESDEVIGNTRKKLIKDSDVSGLISKRDQHNPTDVDFG